MRATTRKDRPPIRPRGGKRPQRGRRRLLTRAGKELRHHDHIVVSRCQRVLNLRTLEELRTAHSAVE